MIKIINILWNQVDSRQHSTKLVFHTSASSSNNKWWKHGCNCQQHLYTKDIINLVSSSRGIPLDDENFLVDNRSSYKSHKKHWTMGRILSFHTLQRVSSTNSPSSRFRAWKLLNWKSPNQLILLFFYNAHTL